MKKSKKTFSMNDDYSVVEELGFEAGASTGKDNHGGAQAAIAGRELSEQVDQVVQGLSGLKNGGQVYFADVRQLEPYPEHPFYRYPLERLRELAEDIALVGILNPILVRRQKRKLQILAGHNRCQAAVLAGLSQVPVIILDVNDDEAVLVLTSTNLRQRERLQPSEKAFAYKMQMEALRRQGHRGAESYEASSFITKQTGDSRMQINRYIRLTRLEPGLLKLLDDGKISMTTAVEVSAIKPGEQREVLRFLLEAGVRLSIEKAGALKIASENHTLGCLSAGEIRFILDEPVRNKKPGKYFKISMDKLCKLLPEGMPEEMIEGYVVDAVRLMREKGLS